VIGVKYLAIAALAATFWLSVATLRLMIHEPGPRARASQMTPPQLSPSAPSGYARRRGYLCTGGGPDVMRDVFERHSTLPISRIALISGMNAVRPQINACYERFQVPGMAVVKVVVAETGRVWSAHVTGTFEGTPTGACVEAAVKNAWFPPSDRFKTQYLFELE